MSKGYVLPIVLVLVAAMFVMAVAILSLGRGERKSARKFVDHRQAQLAVDAALRDAAEVIEHEMRDDAFILLMSSIDANADNREFVPCMFSARWSGDEFEYEPLFTTSEMPENSFVLRAPALDSESNDASLDWVIMRNQSGQPTARYMFWVEDLQGKIDPRVAGNREGVGGVHRRYGFEDLDPTLPAANQVALYALDPEATNDDQGELAELLIDGRSLMLTPMSSLALVPELGDVLKESMVDSLICGNQPYFERPMVPPVTGISGDVVGRPKMNLNKVLGLSGAQAVHEMSEWVRDALPDFEQRRGAFPDDYLKTLAASAVDYADVDSVPTSVDGIYSGVDSYPVLSEVVLHLHFRRLQQRDGQWVMVWTFRLFAELWNMSNQPVDSGMARLSYEVDLRPSSIGSGVGGMAFDDARLLLDGEKSAHDLEQIGERFYGPPVMVSLKPNEYRFYEFARVDYTIPCSPMLDGEGLPIPEEFDLVEPESEMRGISLIWNGKHTYRVPKILRDPYGLSGFQTHKSRKTAKACIPGHSYGGYGGAVNNMGDPRIAPYLREVPLGENAYPDNLSPHRRNVRRRNIYDRDRSPLKVRHYGRVLPSEWPDGGHDSPVGDFMVTTSHAALPTDQSKWPLNEVPEPRAHDAPQRISNSGRYYCETELGRVFDPVMWLPVYADLDGEPGSGAQDTEVLLRLNSGFYRPEMPERRLAWPEVTDHSEASAHYGGGNTLRVGRPEHQRFDRDGWRASRLLDLFHVGVPDSDDPLERCGPLVRVEGHVNLNTASEDVLRCLAAGWLRQDPGLARVVDRTHDLTYAMAAVTEPIKVGAPTDEKLADVLAREIVRNRPYASPSQLAEIKNSDGESLFGNRLLYEDGASLQWSDAAAEELFSRVYRSSTVRSRNLRVWIIGQALDGPEDNLEVVSESRRAFTVFADPGERKDNGELINSTMRVRYAMDF